VNAAANHQADVPARRIVLLGASNLTKGIGTVLETSARLWGGPLEVFAALGHGRSYGRPSRFVGLGLPGIESCGLWRDLAAAPPRPTAALVTDIGNDLLYEEPVERIVSWVAACLDRLAEIEATTLVTLLPVDNLNALSPARFQFFRRLFFPSSRITKSEVTSRALALNEAVARLARERGLPTVEHRAAWYGFDPIHIRFTRRREAWRDILSGWKSDGAALAPSGSAIARTVFLRTRTPHRRHLLWFEQRGKNPAASFRDGTRVSIY